MLDCVILDMDGTLLDTERLAIGAWQRSGRKFGVEIPADFVKSHMGMTREDIDQLYRDSFGPSFPIDAIRAERNVEGMRMAREDPVPVKPGAFELLEHLKARHVPAVLATSTVMERARVLMERSGIWPYLSGAVAGDMIAHGKPAPDIFLEAARRVGADPARSLVCEDSEHGIRGGLAAGCTVAVIPDLARLGEELLARPRVHLFSSLAGVIPLADTLMEEA